jgi:indole-3-glycerol phosphate synthase
MSLLEEILDEKRASLAQLRRAQLPTPPPRRQLRLSRERGEALHIIAEIKHRSPSAGALSEALSVAARAGAYERGGASMISVLCDARYFGGDYAHLEAARGAVALPVLCKEFVVDPIQVDVARAHGADAVLVIVRILQDSRALFELVTHVREQQMEALVEVTTHDEARLALDAGAHLIGVNARDLDSLQMDADRAAKVLASLPEWVTAVHLSGLAGVRDVARVAASQAHAALVGEALMRCDDPEPLLRRLCASCA